MTNTTNHKKSLSKKLLEIQKNGLQQYGKYLDQQLIYASKTEIRKAYKKAIEYQITLNNRRIKNLEDKLKNL